MRSVESKLLGVVLMMALGGCASVSKPMEALEKAASTIVTPVAAEVKAATTPAPAPIDAATQAQFDRALQAQRAGRNDDALKQWTALAQAHPELGGVHANIGVIHRQAGRNVEAVAALEDRKSTRLNSSHPRLSRMPSSA